MAITSPARERHCRLRLPATKGTEQGAGATCTVAAGRAIPVAAAMGCWRRSSRCLSGDGALSRVKSQPERPQGYGRLRCFLVTPAGLAGFSERGASLLGRGGGAPGCLEASSRRESVKSLLRDPDFFERPVSFSGAPFRSHALQPPTRSVPSQPKPRGTLQPARTPPRRLWPLHRRRLGPAGLPRALPAPPGPSRQRRRAAGPASHPDNGVRSSTA